MNLILSSGSSVPRIDNQILGLGVSSLFVMLIAVLILHMLTDPVYGAVGELFPAGCMILEDYLS